MLSLLNAIYTKFTTSSALLAAFPGGMYRDAAPEGAAMPYLVSKVASSKTELAYSTAARTVTQVKFAAYGIGHDATGALADTLTGVFDAGTLTLASGINDSVVRLGDPTPTLLKHDAQGNDVWEWAVLYEYGCITS